MRRLAGILAAFLLIAPSGLRLAASGSDSEALRCAIACGHAMKAGAACCPMDSARDGVTTMTTCPSGDSPAAAPAPAVYLAILTTTMPLAAPQGGSPAFALSPAVPRGPAAQPPDHVPLLLS